VVEHGAFADTSRIANVWLDGSALNCTQLGLPGGVTCFGDTACDVEYVSLVGDGVCNNVYDTMECARDGGDCA
jgi:hypothetical protein